MLGGGEVFMVVWDCNRTIVTSFLIFHIKIIVSKLTRHFQNFFQLQRTKMLLLFPAWRF